uniref:Retrotransposon gag domain-containing protein n=1 Tax=Knipowitschia caucasica TaxID=637954 RepID=A0AAV2LR44_KNICA
MGAKTYNLLRSLIAPAKPADKTIEEITRTLKNHLNPASLVFAERFRFHKRNQATTETVSEYIAELRRLAEHLAKKSSERVRICGDFKAYLQMEMDESSRKYLTINTHKGEPPRAALQTLHQANTPELLYRPSTRRTPQSCSTDPPPGEHPRAALQTFHQANTPELLYRPSTR